MFKWTILYKSIIPLYLICFGCYILFTRQPDYFDGEIVPAKIVKVYDPFYKGDALQAEYTDGLKTYYASVDGLFSKHQEGERLYVIYEKNGIAHPKNAQAYTFFGYWISLGELFWSIVLLVLSFQLAKAITMNPTPEALLEQLDYKEPSNPKYD